VAYGWLCRRHVSDVESWGDVGSAGELRFVPGLTGRGAVVEPAVASVGGLCGDAESESDLAHDAPLVMALWMAIWRW